MKPPRTSVLRRAGAKLAMAIGAIILWAWSTSAAAQTTVEEGRALESLREEIRTLRERVMVLEAEKSQTGSQAGSIAPTPAAAEAAALENRIKVLEAEKTAQEDAIRAIIKDSMAKTSSKINEFVTLGGNFELKWGHSRDLDFSTLKTSDIALAALQLDFEIQVNDWTSANIVLDYLDGNNVAAQTGAGVNVPIDRVTADQAVLTIGDVQRFPLYARVGRMVLPFGISTGSPWADVLSVDNPLTIEAFEFKNTAIGLNLSFPTPPLAPAPLPVRAPRVKPLVVAPYVNAWGNYFGYHPSAARPIPPPPLVLTPKAPPFNAGVYLYSGSDRTILDKSTYQGHYGATMGYRTKSDCGRPYSELTSSRLCPWSLDMDISYNSSIFDSQFLRLEYGKFLPQMRSVSGLSLSMKSTFGPFSLVAERVGAWHNAVFQEDGIPAGGNATQQAARRADPARRVNIRPSAWQVSMGYQFDWNPWVESIGLQGNFVSIGYSQSHDLEGVIAQDLNAAVATNARVGNLPRRRLLLTAGEWVMDNLRWTVEYSQNKDYPDTGRPFHGTGQTARGISTQLTYVW
jgi:hypothetical protein